MPESTPKSVLLVACGLAAVGGVILFLGWAGFGLWPLKLVALVPLWCALELVAKRSWRAALGVGWLYGTNALGGAAGAFATSWLLIRAVGLEGKR